MNIIYRIIGAAVVILMLPLILLCAVTVFLAWCVSRLWAEEAHMCNGTLGSTTIKVKDQEFDTHTYTIPAGELKAGQHYFFDLSGTKDDIRGYVIEKIVMHCAENDIKDYTLEFGKGKKHEFIRITDTK